MPGDLRAHLLLVTATKVETRAVLAAFSAGSTGAAQAPPQTVDGRVYFDLGAVNGTRVALTQSEMGAGGLGASMQSVGKGIAALSPHAVVLVGIAFGMSEEKQEIGDVLISEQLRPYELQRVGTAKNRSAKIILRDDKPHASSSLLNILRSSEVTWEGAALRFGTILTGAKLIDNVDFRNQLSELEPEAVGGEMEGAGLYVACHDRKVDWILVKAICDFADGNKAVNKEERQALAARNAASFVVHALQFVRINWETHLGSEGLDAAPTPTRPAAAPSSAKLARRQPKASRASAPKRAPSTRSGTPRMQQGDNPVAPAPPVVSAMTLGLGTHHLKPPALDRVLDQQFDLLNELAALFDGKSELELRDDAALQDLLVLNWLKIVDDYAYSAFQMRPKHVKSRPYYKTGRSMITKEGLLKHFQPVDEHVMPLKPPKKEKPARSSWLEYEVYELRIPDRFSELQDSVQRFAESRFMPAEGAPLIRAYLKALSKNVDNVWQVLREAAAEMPTVYPTFDLLQRATPDAVLFRHTSRVQDLKKPADAIVAFVRRFMTVDLVRRNR